MKSRETVQVEKVLEKQQFILQLQVIECAHEDLDWNKSMSISSFCTILHNFSTILL